MSDNNELAKEIVIVRRRKQHGEEGHHGGVWKIAYADFMTAMMAFFLVMWLVNMTDDKTIVQIANYFNPLQLTNRNPTEKGLYDADSRSEAAATQSDTDEPRGDGKPRSPGQARMEKARKEKSAADEAKLFVDPMKTLDGVAKSLSGAIPEAGTRESLAGLDEAAMPQQQRPSGPDLMDPFDPFQSGREQPSIPLEPNGNGLTGKKRSQGERGDGVQSQAGAGSSDLDHVNRPDPMDAESSSAKDVSQDQLRANQLLAQSIEASIKMAARGLREDLPAVSVKALSDGVLISIADRDDIEMFRSGSAEPLPQTVKLLDRIGIVIAKSNRRLIVRGHTDRMPFKSSSYDNWRLSTARAHMAHYMLRRAGVPDKQVEKIEGYAASQLLNVGNPIAPENRRVEFLLRISE